MKVLMIGPHVTVKGGISSVIGFIQNSEINKIHDITYIASYKDYSSKMKKLFKGLSSYFVFLYQIIFHRPQIVHVHTAFGASFYRKSVFFISSALFNIPVINHIHGSEFDSFYKNASPFKRRFVSFIYRIAAKTIVLSDSWLEEIRPVVAGKELFVLNNFTVIDETQLPYDSRDKNILFLGRIESKKGVYDMPEIVKLVLAEIAEANFIICGYGDIEKVNDKMKLFGVDNHVHFTGWVLNDEKRAILGNGKVFLLPTYYEGQPMSVLEAMGYGMPIVSTNVGGIPEMIENGVNGFLTEPGNKADMAKHIIQLLKDSDLSEKISLNNMEKIKTSYTLEIFIDKLNALYQSFNPTHSA